MSDPTSLDPTKRTRRGRAPWLVAAASALTIIGCAEKSRMTPHARTGPKASAPAKGTGAAPAKAPQDRKGHPAAGVEPLAILARYSGQIVHDSPRPGEQKGRVIRQQAGYDTFVEALPKLRIQMKQPSPPNDDPLVKKPKIDFTRHMLVVAIRRRMFYKPKIERILLTRGKELIVEVLHESPDGIMAMASRSDVGTYEAVVVPRTDEEAVFRVDKRIIKAGGK